MYTLFKKKKDHKNKFPPELCATAQHTPRGQYLLMSASRQTPKARAGALITTNNYIITTDNYNPASVRLASFRFCNHGAEACWKISVSTTKVTCSTFKLDNELLYAVAQNDAMVEVFQQCTAQSAQCLTPARLLQLSHQRITPQRGRYSKCLERTDSPSS